MAATAGRRAGPVGRIAVALVALSVAVAGAAAGASGAGANGKRPEPVSERIEPLAVDPSPAVRATPTPRGRVPSGERHVDPAAVGVHADDPIDMKVLVITAEQEEWGDFAAITLALDRLGVPYDVLDARDTTLTPAMLWDGDVHGYYQAVILTHSHLWPAGQWQSAFDWPEWTALWDYETRFGVRHVTLETSPTLPAWPDDWSGLEYEAEGPGPADTWLTPQGQEVFAYLQPGATIEFDHTWLYLARADDSAATATTPLLVDSEGHPIVSVTEFTDGREYLAVTAANGPHLLQTTLLSYGIVNWATRGMFLGERHVSSDVQVDDLLFDGDEWPRQDGDEEGPTYRLTADDLAALVAWQDSLAVTYPELAGFTLELAYNGEGATGVYDPDDLTPAVIAMEKAFNWVNHGYEHLDLNSATFREARREIVEGRNMAKKPLRLTHFFRDAFVQPDISGLENEAFFEAAAAAKVKYAISDTSRDGWWIASSPNTGVYDPYGFGVLVLPRRPTNIFYNVTTPEEVELAYNHYYGEDGVWWLEYGWGWGEDKEYAEILDIESDFLLSYLLAWELYPWMFHQGNLRAYDGEHSVLGDLLEATFAKYTALYRLPVRNLTQHHAGGLIAQRMDYDASGVAASLMPCGTATPSVTVTAERTATVPVTGVAYGSNVETYGGQPISYVTVSPAAPVTIPLTCPVG